MSSMKQEQCSLTRTDAVPHPACSMVERSQVDLRLAREAAQHAVGRSIVVCLADPHALQQLRGDHVLQVFACSQVRDSVALYVPGDRGSGLGLLREFQERGALAMVERIGQRHCFGHDQQAFRTLAHVLDELSRRGVGARGITYSSFIAYKKCYKRPALAFFYTTHTRYKRSVLKATSDVRSLFLPHLATVTSSYDVRLHGVIACVRGVT